MAIVPLFKNKVQNCCVVHGPHRIAFVAGRFWTDDPTKQKLLQKMAERRDHGVFIDPNEPDIDTEAATPYEVMKKKIISEFLAAQAVPKDAGSSHVSQEAAAQSVTATTDSETNGLQSPDALGLAEKLKVSQKLSK